MILSALNDLYELLLAEPDPISGLARVPKYGYTEEKIGYIIQLSKEGKVVDVTSNFVPSATKPVASFLTVPWSFDRAGKFTEKAFSEGKNPAFFLWDKSKYLLGIERDEVSKKWRICDLEFRASKALHDTLLADTDDAGLAAVRLFFSAWKPEGLLDSLIKPDMLGSNFTFKLDGDLGHICDRPAAQEIWDAQIGLTQNAVTANCLVTNQSAPLKVTHQKIKGGYLARHGGQSSGCSLISYNETAFTSYSKEQGENAPISESAAFAYTTALNYLLKSSNRRCFEISDASLVFWAVAESVKVAVEAELNFDFLLNQPRGTDELNEQLRSVMEKISHGKDIGDCIDKATLSARFFLLGVSPNAARLSVRYWFSSSFGEVASNFFQHFKDLSLDLSQSSHAPSVRSLLLQTVARRKNSKGKFVERENKEISPQLSAELLRAIISGQRYPQSLLAKLILRIRSDGDIHPFRVRMIKAIVCRNDRLSFRKESVSMSLNREEINVAYRLGRLFSVFERAQECALGNVNAGIRDRFYGAASCTPKSIFPLLHKNFGNHISKLRKGAWQAKWISSPVHATKVARWLDREVGLILEPLDSLSPFPHCLTLSEQGNFIVGYYQQRTDRAGVPAKLFVDPEIASDVDADETIENQGE